MTEEIACRITETAVALRRSHPGAPALDVLDLVLKGRESDSLTFPARLVAPRSPFGQLIAEAFDHGMSAADWFDWTGPAVDPEQRRALLRVWDTFVLPRFRSRFGTRVD